MKRYISKISIFIICVMMVMLLLPVSKPVKAADDPNTVYYQGLVQNGGGGHSAVTAVSQYYYSSPANTNGISYTARTDNFTSITETTICSIDGSDGLCNSGKLRGSYASLIINYSGNITITVDNGIKIDNLRIFYILASNGQLICQTNQLCDNAKTIHNNQYGVTNWSNKSQYGVLVFRYETLAEKFTKNVASSGKETYTGNVFDLIEGYVVSESLKSGLYITTSMVVESGAIKYYVNDYTIDKKVLDGLDNISNTKVQQIIKNDSPGIKHMEDEVKKVARVAALISPSQSNNTEDYRGFVIAEGYFHDTIRPIIIIAIGILFLVVGTSTGITIVKSSDEPDVRRSSIKKLVGLFIGAVTIALILMFYREIIEAVQRFF